jgi:hypothetical protein
MASKIIVDQLEKTGGTLTALTLPSVNATTGQYMQNDGAGGLSWVAAPADVSGFHQLVVRSASGSATYSPAAGVTKIVVIVQGGGGGGAGSAGAYYSSAGSAGGYALKYFTGVASTDVMTVVVGAFGPGYTGAGSGTAGGASQFVSVSGGLHPFTTVEGLGGGRGIANGDPEAGGIASGGDINVTGIQGGPKETDRLGANSMFGFGGSYYGAAAAGGGESTGYGSGGVGAYSVGGAIGRAGRDGLVLIYEYK